MKRPRPCYPAGWKDFSRHIRYERAEGRCECLGHCGLHRTHPGPRRCVERDQQRAVWAHGIIVLTVAHLCSCDPPCIDAGHCLALCNRCHLRVDVPLHQRHAAETRRLAKQEAGQLALLAGMQS